MSRFRVSSCLLIVLASCASTSAPGASSFAAPEAGARVHCDVEQGLLRLRFEARIVDRWGIWIEDGRGERVEPLIALDGSGAAVELGERRSAPVASVLFLLSELESRPWTLRLLPRAAPAWRIVLAEVEGRSVDRASDVFGYRREEWSFPDGGVRVVYARTAPDGSRVEVPHGVFESGVHPSLVRTRESMPETLESAIAVCPEVADSIARGFESGARYQGPAEGDNQHPHARGERFWSRPRSLAADDSQRGREDRIDTLVWFLVEQSNACSAEAYGRIWQGVLDGSLSEGEYLAQETLQKAAHVRRAVEIIRANADCLDLVEGRRRGAVVFEEYERWVRESRGSLRSLARTILRNPARYTSNPSEAGLTYAQRLRGLYREYAPISGARSGW